MLQLILPVIATLLLLTSQTSFAAVGKVTEQTGPTEIVRNKKSIPSALNAGVEMNDTIITAKAKAKLTFQDNTTVNITEQSKLIIDDFVYDPKQGTGKLAVKVALGTARYTSGQIAKTNPQSVNVQTPTATVAVRGTDFSMTVDELGRSLIVLLPSCDKDKKKCVTGAITVKNDAGEVFMDQAYQTTLVVSTSSPPSSPVIVNLDQANINNMLIISPPKEVKESQFESKTALDKNFLEVDLLRYAALNENYLENFRELDMNMLDIEMLFNILDAENAALLASQDVLSTQAQLLPGYNAAYGGRYFFNDDQSKITYCQYNGNHTACVVASVESNKTMNFNQNGVALIQNINKGGDSTVTIIQR
jgi:hypothetical protein